ncbi:MAG: hypothetical protein H7318_05240 [Oligoflexus sp.]|nr:hypothetical protein [Oligoflexus sp.]
MINTHSLTRLALVTGIILTLPLHAETRKKVPASEEGEEAPAADNGSLFPDWTSDRFDWKIGPILGVRARNTEYGGVKYETLSSEIGLGARVSGIPLIPGNPGVTVEPYANYTWGSRNVKAKNDALNETDNTGFQRQWYGILGRLYVKYFRYSLDVGQGRINYDDNLFTDLKSNRFQNDFGLLLLPFLSTHYTLTSYTMTENKESRPSIDELDHWIHARIFFSRFSLDLGPGRSITEYSGRVSANSPMQRIATVNTSYLKALTSMNIFWKLGISGSAKYILSAKQVDGLVNTIDQLPNENLAENKSLANLPKGSLEASIFLGLRSLFSGFGVGYQIYYLELDHGSSAKQISHDQGIVVTYDAGL